jgi:uncharacterized membrane protein YkgB
MKLKIRVRGKPSNLRYQMRFKGFLLQLNRNFIHFCTACADRVLVAGFALIYLWFGALKVVGLSPVDTFVDESIGRFSFDQFSLMIGLFEVVIGLLFLFPRTLKIALILFFIKIPGTFLPLITTPEACFISFPFVLTIQGQYIFKNLILIGAALALYSRHRPNHG